MATIVNARDVILQAASTRLENVSLQGNVTSIPATVTVPGYGSLGGIADDAAQAALDAAAAAAAAAAKLNKSAADTLSGAISLTSSGGFRVGTIAWDSVGTVTSGSGVAITAKGIVGASSGAATFSIDTAGNAYYWGAVSANQITTGSLTAATVNTSSYVRAYGAYLASVSSGGVSYSASVVGESAGPGITYAGVVGKAYAGSGVIGAATTGIGVLGDASGTGGTGLQGTASGTDGIGVAGYSTYGQGVVAQSTAGTALYVDGKMQITTSNLVSNLNADLLDGYQASAFALFGHTHSTYALTSHTHSEYAASSHTHSVYPSQFITQSGTGYISAGTVYFYTSTGLTAYQFFSDGGGSVGIRSVSDAALKQDVEPETLGIDFIRQLNPVRYRMKSDPGVQHHGFIAQHVEPLIQGVDSLKMQYADGVKGMDYLALIAPMVKAIQQIDERLSALENANELP